MTLRALTNGRPPLPGRRVRRNGILQLGPRHFWALVSILGGMLALVGLAFVAHLSTL
jgi:hypothetical protein